MMAEFSTLLSGCRAVFEKKLLDYGPVWLVFRWVSLADQVFIKIRRLRALEESGDRRQVADTPRDEYIGIVNYCLIALMKDEGRLPSPEEVLSEPAMLGNLPPEEVLGCYDQASRRALDLLAQKNHDYGAAWRCMAIASITDQMLVKILRVKHILDSARELAAADSLPAQFMDIMNYSLFSLLLTEGDERGNQWINRNI